LSAWGVKKREEAQEDCEARRFGDGGKTRNGCVRGYAVFGRESVPTDFAFDRIS